MTSDFKYDTLVDRMLLRAQILVKNLLDKGEGNRSPTEKTSSSRESGSIHNTSAVNDNEEFANAAIKWVLEALLRIGVGFLMMYMCRKIIGRIMDEDEGSESEHTTRGRLSKLLDERKAKNSRIKAQSIPPLSKHELIIAQGLILPNDMSTGFAEVGGLDAIKREIYQLAILPLVQPHLFKSSLVSPTRGILLYGKPGVGKTMLAKAIAKEAHAVFIPLQLSKILSKWVGESNKLVAAAFSLAYKVQPCILFVDELDTFLKLSSESNGYLDTIKSDFLTHWDGISTSDKAHVLVLGATNQPHNIDPAILRRMPRTFEIPLPNEQGRLDIITRLFQDEDLALEAQEYLPDLALLTSEYSGSDLKELCKAAAMIRIHEHTKEFCTTQVSSCQLDASSTDSATIIDELRQISKADLMTASTKVQRTGAAAHSYGREQQRERQQHVNLGDIRNLANMLNNLSTFSNLSNDDDDSIPSVSERQQPN